MRKSIPIFYENERNPEKHTNIKGFQNYLEKIIIDVKEYNVRVSVQDLKTKSKDSKGELHSTFISDIEIYENKNSDLLRNTEILIPSSGSIADAKLIQFFKNARNSQYISSKIVDDNGEPLVV